MLNLFPNFRAINIAEVLDGKPVPKSVVVVRFTEAEASVTGIVQKLQADLRTTESPVLLDSNWNEIMDSEGTRGNKTLTICIILYCHLFSNSVTDVVSFVCTVCVPSIGDKPLEKLTQCSLAIFLGFNTDEKG